MTPEAIELSAEYRTQVAAEVAARYGVICQPEAVQAFSRGVSSFPVYQWDGHQLASVDGKNWRDRAKLKMAAQQRGEKFRRAAEVARAERVAPTPRQQPKIFEQVRERIALAAKQRAAEVAAFAADGKTAAQVAAFMQISERSARKYCALKGIALKPSDRKLVGRRTATETTSKILAAAPIMNIYQLCEAFGMSSRRIYALLGYHKVKCVPLPKGPAKSSRKSEILAARRAETVAARAARREAVRELALTGMQTSDIARRLGLTSNVVRKDRAAMGCSVAPCDAKGDRKPTTPMEVIRARQAERDDRIAALRAEGKMVREIMAALNCGASAVTNGLRRKGLSIGRGGAAGKIGNQTIVAQVCAMAATGRTRRQIATELGMASSTVQRILERAREARATRKEAA